jgi:hypothetical protein
VSDLSSVSGENGEKGCRGLDGKFQGSLAFGGVRVGFKASGDGNIIPGGDEAIKVVLANVPTIAASEVELSIWS